MKRSLIFSLVIIGAILLSACGAEATPTASVADIQSTAVSAAFTIVAQTQAAIPTATPLPPTETPTQTPLPSNTPLPLPSLEATLTSVPAGGDPCATRVLGAPRGRETIIKIENSVRAPVTVSLYLNETASHNECGYRGYNLSANGSVVISDLVQGCYNLWAWSTGNTNPFNSSGYGCINNPDKWTFVITRETIQFNGP